MLDAEKELDAVVIATPDFWHAPQAVDCLRAGKHVYCEKPMAGAYRDALAMFTTAKELDRKLSIQLSTLFSKETKAARILIEQGLLGKLYHARSTGFRRRGRPFVDGYGKAEFVKKEVAAGGAMYDMGVYHVANLLYLLGNPQVLRISGKTYQEIDMDRTRRESSGYSVEEIGLGFIRLQGNLSLDIIEAWAVHLDHIEGSVVLGSQGGLRLEPFGFFQNIDDLDLNTGVDLGGLDWRLHTLRPNPDAYDSPQQHWIAALQGRVPLLPTAELALNHLLISEGIYLSERLGREVTSEEVNEMSVSTAADI
jgi:predicted dehydrogenase